MYSLTQEYRRAVDLGAGGSSPWRHRFRYSHVADSVCLIRWDCVVFRGSR